MKIIISENQIDNIKSLLDKLGVKEVIDLMGGSDNFIKIIGYDDIEKYIYKYLDENCEPDYGWESPEYYKEQVDRFDSIQFYINDKLSFDYTKYVNDYKKLDVYPWLYNELEEIFEIDGDNSVWIKVFGKWFEDKTGLRVDRVI